MIVPRGGKKSDRARAARGAGAGDRASRGRLPRVRRPRRGSRHGAGHRAQRQDAPHRRLRRGRDAAGGSRLRGTRTSARWSRCCSRPAARCAATRRPRDAIGRVKPATEQDWYTEYLDAIIAVRVVEGVDAAIAHIAQYGSQHTDCIVTDDARRGGALLDRGSTAPSCCTTPRRSSPTAASSAWVPRSASARTSFTRAVRWASSSSPATNTGARQRPDPRLIAPAGPGGYSIASHGRLKRIAQVITPTML